MNIYEYRINLDNSISIITYFNFSYQQGINWVTKYPFNNKQVNQYEYNEFYPLTYIKRK